MPEQRLRDVAEVVRSKNAGPHRLTLDIIFKEVEVLDKVLEGGSLTPEKVTEAYGLQPSALSSWFIFRPGRALKFTFIRPIDQGGPGETDIYGAQQHAPLMDLEVQL
ncbi:DUF4387 domain-containing protein [Brevibacterium spongiae]|uniref:DUF4387 domain-containing protein n=1 Tax=Brevibacterium spongiae TaxID=2909672 RepID=A0ABY5SQ11_9MICO|nr:DUF4387 domain-containing protein [Brevibacterium spongiae]UVI36628.1 DUF4387 domain-containing protein [Brevibacterium spongiae]